MKVQATMNTTVEIDKKKQQHIIEKYLSKMFDVLPGSEINDKDELVFYWDESVGDHFIQREKFIRKATENDRLYFKFLEALEKILLFEEDEE